MNPFPLRARVWLALLIAAALVIGSFLTRGIPPPTPNPPGTFSFAALGDAPYYSWEELQYRLVLKELDAADLTAVIHVGDIFWRPCSDEHYKETLARFNELRHPVIYTPGDNEWTDCWESQSGGFKPLERLNSLRSIFYANNPKPPAVTRQNVFLENARWQQEGIVFATVHLVGSGNALKRFPGRTAEDDTAVTRRTEAAETWIRETFAAAKAVNARAVVIAFHASPAFEEPVGHPYRRPFEHFLALLADEVERFGKPVLVIHGDDHEFVVDHPLLKGRRLANFTRMEVPGSPDVGWVRVFATQRGEAKFSFEKHVVPDWKYW